MDTKKNIYWVVGGIVACIAGFFVLNMFLNRSATNQEPVDTSVAQGDVVTENTIRVPDQASESQIFVEEVRLKTDGNGGFVVIRRVAEGGVQSDEIGVSDYIKPGANKNIVVSLNVGETLAVGEKLVAELYGDDDDMLWNGAETDKLLMYDDGSPVMSEFTILAEEDLPGFDKKL